MKKLSILTAAMLAVVGVAYATGPDVDNRTPVNPYGVKPDGTKAQFRMTDAGEALVSGTVAVEGPVVVASADGGIPEVSLGDFGTATQPAAVDLSVNAGSAWGEVLCPASVDISVPAIALEGRREVLVQNLGPNPVYLCPGTPCTVAAGVKLQADEEWRSFAFGSGITLSCIATVADQVSGAGLRYLEVK